MNLKLKMMKKWFIVDSSGLVATVVARVKPGKSLGIVLVTSDEDEAYSKAKSLMK